MSLLRFFLRHLLFLLCRWFVLVGAIGGYEVETDDEEEYICFSIAENISEGVSAPVSRRSVLWLVGLKRSKYKSYEEKSYGGRIEGNKLTLMLDRPNCPGCLG
jgi:hypothetical protein